MNSATDPPTGPGVPEVVVATAAAATRVSVLTGAGMSAESGVPTFRDAQTGLWARFDATALATPEAWRTDPQLVWAWYLWRLSLVRAVDPNDGHRALSAWAALPGVDLRVVTQNVDDLHERAGSVDVAHVHGSLLHFRCDRCGTPYDDPVVPPDPPLQRVAPPSCRACPGRIRPGVVWFGESLPAGAFELATRACLDADLLVVVGTSGLVHPAAGLPALAAAHGVPMIEVNPEPTAISHQADHVWRTTAALGLPALVDRLAGAARKGDRPRVPGSARWSA